MLASSRRSLGRLYGHVSEPWFANPFEPGVYAVVAASALIAGATHTISPCIVMIEITAQANNIMPQLVGTMVGYAVAGMFTVSLYDMMLDISHMPYLPRVRSAAIYRQRAQNVMHTAFPFLSLESTAADAVQLLAHRRHEAEDSSSAPQFPLVDSPRNMVLLGSVLYSDLLSFCAKVTTPPPL